MLMDSSVRKLLGFPAPPPVSRASKREKNVQLSYLPKLTSHVDEVLKYINRPPNLRFLPHVVVASPQYSRGAFNKISTILRPMDVPLATHQLTNTVKSVQKKVEGCQLIITEADKGNSVVVLYIPAGLRRVNAGRS